VAKLKPDLKIKIIHHDEYDENIVDGNEPVTKTGIQG
jgi:hypothetical protein